MTAQTPFTRAVLDPARAIPAGLVDPQGRPAGKRFDVYRNNVVVSLMKALATAFPVLAEILGPSNFDALAANFVRQHPPASPLMMHYGAALPGFLEAFAPLQAYPWLADLARLELALRESYHAADADPIPRDALATLSPGELLEVRIRLASATRLVRSRYPVLSLWRRTAQPEQKGEAVLITRPEFDPRPQLLPPGGATFVLALTEGDRLGAALDRATAAVPDFDLAAVLGLLIAGNAITAI